MSAALAEAVQDEILAQEARLETLREMLRLAESLERDFAPDPAEPIEQGEAGPNFDEPEGPERPRHDDREAAVLRALAGQGVQMRRGELVRCTGMNENTIHDVLARLVAGGQVTRTGKKAGTRYELNLSDNGDGPRRCADEDCETVLSAYNEGDYCSVHEGQAVEA